MNNRSLTLGFLGVAALSLVAAGAYAGEDAPAASAPARAASEGEGASAKGAAAKSASPQAASAKGASAEGAAHTVRSGDLASFLADTPWAAAEAALRESDAEAAAKKAEGLARPGEADAALAAGILQARIAEAAGRHAEAGKRWASLAGDADAAAPFLRLRAARAALDGGDAKAAAAVLADLPRSEGALLRLEVATALSDAGAAEEARGVLGDARTLPRTVRPEALALEAKLLEAAGRKDEARGRWLELYLSHPATAAARPAEERIRALAGKEDAPPTVAQEVNRLEALLDAHANHTVIREAERLLPRLKRKGPLGCRVRYALGKAHRKARNYRDAIDVLSKVVGDCEEGTVRLKALYLWASASSILEKDPAIPVYERLAKEYPEHAYADDALFFIADLHLRAGRLEAARKVLADQAARYPDGDYHAEALWRLFWLARTEGRTAEALQRLDAILKAYGGKGGEHAFEAERALYWKARLLADDPDRRAEAVAAFDRLFREHPLSYHAAQGLARLAALDPERAAALRKGLEAAPEDRVDWSVRVPARFLADGQLRLGIRLLRLGLPEEAAGVLEDVKAKDTDAALLLALLLDRAGDPHGSHWLIRTRVRDFDRTWPAGGSWRIWRAAYPLAFREEVTAAASEFGIPPDLLQAIIREESALQPEIVSWAGAVGLAQLMPYTAKDLARRIGLTGRVDLDTLRDPQTNLRLSARYLSDLLKLFDGNVALAISAYNAGERTVMGWARRRKGWDLDAFVEAISIAETRRYTRRVLRSYVTYRYLYGKGADRFLALPEKVAIGAD